MAGLYNIFNSSVDKLVNLPCKGILLAVSGGVDSMVMADLFLRQSAFPLAVAHMNFSLRGEESDADEAFVRDWASSHNLPFFCRRVDTVSEAAGSGRSIEMTARDLRYQWFNTLLDEHNLDYVAVAHQANDVAETMLLNLTRGTGLRGLCGIRASSGRVIRPMLEIERSRILEFAQAQGIAYRTDSTNADTTYRRNAMRNLVIPAMEQINPSLVKTFYNTASRLRQLQNMLDSQQTSVMAKVMPREDEISIPELLKTSAPSYWLFEILSPMGFSPSQIDNLSQAIDKESGKFYPCGNKVVWKDRDSLFIRDVAIDSSITFTLSYKIVPKTEDFYLSNGIDEVCLDADSLSFPLSLRKWSEGDRFRPIGMKGFKKISDFLIDQKVPRNQKQDVMLVCSGEDIVWLVGFRPDDRFKVTSKTTNICYLTLISNINEQQNYAN